MVPSILISSTIYYSQQRDKPGKAETDLVIVVRFDLAELSLRSSTCILGSGDIYLVFQEQGE